MFFCAKMDIKIENHFKSINLGDVCRACLSECDEMTSLFTEIESTEEDDEMFIYQILMHVTSMQVLDVDGLPSLICKKCIESANNAFKFKVLCDRSESLLQTYMNRLRNKEEDSLSRSETSKPKNEHDIIESSNNTGIEVKASDNMSKEIEYFKMEPNSDTDENVKQELLVISEEYQVLDTKETIKSEIYNLDESSETHVQIETYSDEEHFKSEATLVASSEENVKLRDRIALKKVYAQMNNSKNVYKMRKARSYFHPYRMDENGEKRYVCEYCNKEYKHSTSLTVHIRSHTMERPYLCTLCGKGFKQITGLKYHMRSHSGEQPYACTLCDKRYRQSASLTAHIRIHTGQRPFLCSVCGKQFRQAPDLGYHMRTHTKEKPYRCNICGKRMTMQCHLVQHMRTHTGEKPYPCNQCGKAFASTTRLKRHEIIHTDLKPFSCDVCKKCFNRASTLRIHAITHTANRPHVCQVCAKGFIQAHCLRTHMKIHQ